MDLWLVLGGVAVTAIGGWLMAGWEYRRHQKNIKSARHEADQFEAKRAEFLKLEREFVVLPRAPLIAAKLAGHNPTHIILDDGPLPHINGAYDHTTETDFEQSITTNKE